MWLFLAFSLLVYSTPAGGVACGYESCDLGRPGFINVHIVPHTHDDVGWLKTVDQYFYGARNDIQQAGVQYIIDSMVDALVRNPKRKFTYVEMGFFYRWWKQQNGEIRNKVRQLVNEGRLHFTLGAWSMADEASTHYTSIIDAHTLGLRFLDENFGDCGRPRAAWQIDPFGHQREFANLFAQLGYDSFYVGRIDYQDYGHRRDTHNMEMIWRGSPDNKSEHSVFTGVLYSGYGPPCCGFFWDVGAQDAPVMDDPDLEDYNVDDRVNAFIHAAQDQDSVYQTGHQMWTMGSDFNYQSADTWFVNMDRLIKHVNERIANGSKVYAMYSTPACYTYAVNKAKPNKWTVKYDDFMPYAHDSNRFWTGYFTSRAALKGYERLMSNFLQVSGQLSAMANLGVDEIGNQQLFRFRDAMGIVQHHDGVSGTEKQHVAFDYARRLAAGSDEGEKVLNSAYQTLATDKTDAANPTNLVPKQYFCWLMNETICDFTTDPSNADSFLVTIYNPLSRHRSHWTRIPVIYDSYTVTDSMGKSLPVQIVPVSNITQSLWNVNGYTPRMRSAQYELVFAPSNLPGMGWETYTVKRSTSRRVKLAQQSTFMDTGSNLSVDIANDLLSLRFDTQTGLLSSITLKKSGIMINATQSLQFYEAYQADGQQDSGAYIFRPKAQMPKTFPSAKITFLNGPLVQEVYQVFGDYAAQVTRLYTGDDTFEIEWTVGPIDISDSQGREVISLYQTSLKNNKTYYTDSNGRQMMKRILDYRPTWDFRQTEPVAGNYYPVNSRIFINDPAADLQFTVLTDRSEGGASIESGEVELMVHRRLLRDDGLGVGEDLNEPGISGKGLIVRGTHYVLLNTITNSNAIHRDAGVHYYFKQVPTFSKPMGPISSKLSRWSGLTMDTPMNVQVLTLQEWTGGDLLLRLEHLFQPGEHPFYSQNVTINIKNLFTAFTPMGYTELSLGANMEKADMLANRLKWTGTDEESVQSPTNANNMGKFSNRVKGFGDLKYQPGHAQQTDHARSAAAPYMAAIQGLKAKSTDQWDITLQAGEIRTFQLHL